MKRILTYSIILCTVCSCAIYDRYDRKSNASAVEPVFRLGQTEGPKAASLSWNEFFQDTQLQSYIAEALDSNADARKARLKLEARKSMLTSMRLAYLPTLSSDATDNLKTDDFTAGADAVLQLDLFGKVTTAKRTAEAQTEAAAAYAQAVEADLVATVAAGYCKLMMLDRNLEISEETLASWDRSISTLVLMKEAGKANDLAVTQAKANRLRLESAIIAARQEIFDTENAFCSLLGRPSGQVKRGRIEDFDLIDTFSTEVPGELLSNRADVRQAEYELAAAFYTTKSAFADFFPDVSIKARLGWTANGKVLDSPSDFVTSLIASFSEPLFRHGSKRAAYKTAKLEQEQASVAYRQKILDAANRVNSAQNAILAAKGKASIDKERTEMLERAMGQTELLMEYSGTTTYLEVLTAQQSLLSARQELLSDRYALLTASISLYNALGGR